MFIHKLFPRALTACVALSFLTLPAAAQTEWRLRTVTDAVETDGASRLVNDLETPSKVLDEPALLKSPIALPRVARFDQVMLSAIDERLGAPYVYGAMGPRVFDCSGFVWSVFQSAGINFERVSARDLWATFAPARANEKYKFGTLVFFNNLKHVGIVADEHGFYHASCSHGVTYSPFNDYWQDRIVGFRRVPLPTPTLAE